MVQLVVGVLGSLVPAIEALMVTVKEPDIDIVRITVADTINSPKTDSVVLLEEDNILERSVSVRENWDSSKATMDTVIWSIFKDHVKKGTSLYKAVKEHNVDTTTALRVRISHWKLDANPWMYSSSQVLVCLVAL